MTSIPFKSTKYAPDIYKALNGILLVYKPPNIKLKAVMEEFREHVTDSLNELKPRPMAAILKIVGETDQEKTIIERPNLADHPLVAGPRYVPWELRVATPKPILNYKSSGVSVFLLGSACRYHLKRMTNARYVNVYHLTGTFGYVTDNYFSDGKILAKSTYNHIRTGKLDSVLARIEATQNDRLFDASSVPIDSQEAYELAKSWPSRPAKMAEWPVIYRLRCIHCKLPHFKLEITVVNETEHFLAQICHDVGQMLRSAAYTDSIRRVKFGPFSIDDCLTDKDFELQAILNNVYSNQNLPGVVSFLSSGR